MSHRIVARVASASAVTALLLSMLATPAAAAGHTSRWVDDDLSAGDGPNQCDTAGYSSIQDAIDDSTDGDLVYVCPGTYTEQLVITSKVKVRARPLHGATIIAPADGLPGPGALAEVYVGANGAVVRGFNIDIPAGAGGGLTVNPECEHYDIGIWVLAQDAVVRNNRIRATGDATLNGSCGYDYGIVVGSTSGSATARVTFNWVTNFKIGGILVQAADSYAWIRRNTVRFFHENDCAVIAISCTVSVRPSVNGLLPLTFGIGVESSARADIRRNWIGSGPDACVNYGLCGPTITPTTQALNWGIALTALDGAETTDVYWNVVERAVGGIVTSSGADGAVIHGNYVNDSHYGYQIGGDNDEWHDNHTSGNAEGASVGPAASGNNIHDNDFRGNTLDCHDQSSGSETANTANTWTNDLGNSDDPDGICNPDI